MLSERPSNEGDWIAEQVVWTQWVHLGELRARDESDLLLIDPKKFADVILMSPPALDLARVYAGNFLAWLNTIEAQGLSDILRLMNGSRELLTEFMGHLRPVEDDR